MPDQGKREKSYLIWVCWHNRLRVASLYLSTVFFKLHLRNHGIYHCRVFLLLSRISERGRASFPSGLQARLSSHNVLLLTFQFDVLWCSFSERDMKPSHEYKWTWFLWPSGTRLVPTTVLSQLWPLHWLWKNLA